MNVFKAMMILAFLAALSGFATAIDSTSASPSEYARSTGSGESRAVWQRAWDSPACQSARSELAANFSTHPPGLTDFLASVNATARVPCGLDAFGAIPETDFGSGSIKVGSPDGVACPGADGIGDNTISVNAPLPLVGQLASQQLVAAGGWTGTVEGHGLLFHSDSAVVSLSMDGDTRAGTVHVLGVPLPAFGDASSRCGVVTTTTCAPILWWQYCVTSSTVVPCEASASGDVLHLGVMIVHGRLEAAIDPCKTGFVDQAQGPACAQASDAMWRIINANIQVTCMGLGS